MLQQYCGRLHRNFEGKDEVQDFLWIASKVMFNGIQVIVFEKKPILKKSRRNRQIVFQVWKMQELKFTQKKNFLRIFVLLMKKIMWYGSVNYLGFSEKEACCMRICDAKITSEIEGEIIK